MARARVIVRIKATISLTIKAMIKVIPNKTSLTTTNITISLVMTNLVKPQLMIKMLDTTNRSMIKPVMIKARHMTNRDNNSRIRATTNQLMIKGTLNLEIPKTTIKVQLKTMIKTRVMIKVIIKDILAKIIIGKTSQEARTTNKILQQV